MRKTSFVLAIMVVMAGISAEAQKKSGQIELAPPTVQPQNVIIQDDGGGGFLLFDPITGAYKSTLCEYGYAFSGKGQVKVDGCNIYFSDIQPGYRIFASLNMCDHQAKCAFEVFEEPNLRFDIEPIFKSLVDTNMLNSTAECGVTVSPK